MRRNRPFLLCWLIAFAGLVPFFNKSLAVGAVSPVETVKDVQRFAQENGRPATADELNSIMQTYGTELAAMPNWDEAVNSVLLAWHNTMPKGAIEIATLASSFERKRAGIADLWVSFTISEQGRPIDDEGFTGGPAHSVENGSHIVFASKGAKMYRRNLHEDGNEVVAVWDGQSRFAMYDSSTKCGVIDAVPSPEVRFMADYWPAIAGMLGNHVRNPQERPEGDMVYLLTHDPSLAYVQALPVEVNGIKAVVVKCGFPPSQTYYLDPARAFAPILAEEERSASHGRRLLKRTSWDNFVMLAPDNWLAKSVTVEEFQLGEKSSAKPFHTIKYVADEIKTGEDVADTIFKSERIFPKDAVICDRIMALQYSPDISATSLDSIGAIAPPANLPSGASKR